MRDALQAFHHFFLQDETSKKLLESIDFKNNTVVGDTRFDRVSKILQQDNSLDFISEFKKNFKLFFTIKIIIIKIIFLYIYPDPEICL